MTKLPGLKSALAKMATSTPPPVHADNVPAHQAPFIAQTLASKHSAAVPQGGQNSVRVGEFIPSAMVHSAKICRPVGQIDSSSSCEKCAGKKCPGPAGRFKLPKLCVSRVTDFFHGKLVAVKEANQLQMVIHGSGQWTLFLWTVPAIDIGTFTLASPSFGINN